MKATAAFQIFTTIMASGGDEWQVHMPQGPEDVTARADLDLGACLDVEALEAESSPGLYTDSETQDNTWVENIIDLTSSGEMTSSGEHLGIVPVTNISGSFAFVPESDMGTYSNVDLLSTSDNATFDTMQGFASAETTIDLTQLTGVVSGYSMTQPTTGNLASLEQLMTIDPETTSQTSDDATCNSSSCRNIPSSLWNIDLTVDVAEQSGSDVRNRMRSRLYAKGVSSSTSQDSDVMLDSSRRSHTSSTSSWNLSIDDDDGDDDSTDDLQKDLEKREKNRLAAQKCRNRKKDKTESLQKDVSRLEEKQEKLKEEVRKLRDERETLEEIIHIHGAVCPKIRKISKS